MGGNPAVPVEPRKPSKPRKPNPTRSAEHMRELCDKRVRASRERRIQELIEKSPPLLPEQCARLRVLLSPAEGGSDAAA